MGPAEHEAMIRQLTEAFGVLSDVTPGENQPLHVIFNELVLPGCWRPSPARALAIFANWPDQRPEFFVELALTNANGEPPRSHRDEYKVGETWRGFSFTFGWPQEPATCVRAIQLWITRFSEKS